MRPRTLNLFILLGLTLTVAATAGAATNAPILAQAVADEIPAAQLQLPPDTRAWTDKVPAALLREAGHVSSAPLDCIVTFRRPEVLRSFEPYGAGHKGRLAWIQDTADQVESSYVGVGVKVLERYSHLPMVHAAIPREALPALASDPLIESVSPVMTAHALRLQGETLMHVPQVAALGYNGTGVTVAVLDSGVDYTHPELSPGGTDAAAKTIKGADVIDNDGDPMDVEGHGTEVAGIVAGSTGGVAPKARIYAVRVLGSDGQGSSNQILSGINNVISTVSAGNPYNIKVANLSLGGYADGVWDPNPGNCDLLSDDFKTAFDTLAGAAVLTVISAGNGGCTNGVAWPACVSTALAVGAVYDANLGRLETTDTLHCTGEICSDPTTGPDVVACYSDSGDRLDVWAPSHCSNTTKMGGGYDTCFGGTSASAPYAAGVAALLTQAVPTRTASALKEALRSAGQDVTDPRNSITRKSIRADAALTVLQSGCTPPGTPTGLSSNRSSVCSGEQFTLTWTAGSPAPLNYTVELATDSSFVNTINLSPSTFSSTSVNITLTGTSATPIFAHVKANASCGASSAWSNVVQLAFTGTCNTTTYAYSTFVSGIARAPGYTPAYWYSDLAVLNGGGTTAQIRLSYFGTSTPTPVTGSLPAGQQATWTDVLNSAFGITSTDAGVILVESTAPVTAVARTYSRLVDPVDGKIKTYGQSMPGVTVGGALAYGATGYLPNLRSDGAFRTNVEAVNVGTVTTDIEFRFFSNSGAQIGVQTIPGLAPNRRSQITLALPSGYAAAYARVRVLTSGGKAIAFASVVDGNSTDPTTVELVTP